MTTLLTATEAAVLLRMRPDHLFRLARRGAVPALRFGRAVRFDLDVLLKLGAQAGEPQLRPRAPRVAPVAGKTPSVRVRKPEPRRPVSAHYAHLRGPQ